MNYSPSTPALSKRVIGPSARQSTSSAVLQSPSRTSPTRVVRGPKSTAMQLEVLPEYPPVTSGSGSIKSRSPAYLSTSRGSSSSNVKMVNAVSGFTGNQRSSQLKNSGGGSGKTLIPNQHNQQSSSSVGNPSSTVAPSLPHSASSAMKGSGRNSKNSATTYASTPTYPRHTVGSSANDCVLLDDDLTTVERASYLRHTGLPVLSPTYNGGKANSSSSAVPSGEPICGSVGVPNALHLVKPPPAPLLANLNPRRINTPHGNQQQLQSTPLSVNSAAVDSILVTSSTPGQERNGVSSHHDTSGANLKNGRGSAKFTGNLLDGTCLEAGDVPQCSITSPSIIPRKTRGITSGPATDTCSSILTQSTDSLVRSSSTTNVLGGLSRTRSIRVSLAHKALIGKGSYGIVFKAMDRDTNRLIAVKEISLGAGGKKDSAHFQKQLASVCKELALLKQLDHPNIVKCLGEECEEDCLRIYMEFIAGGSVSSLLRTFGPFQESQASNFTQQLLSGLVYLHCKGIIHRDLKGDNLLVDTAGVLKLADFGTARDMSVTTTCNNAVAGTAYFIAPEVVAGVGTVNEKADIWAVGCCVVEMLTGLPPLSHIPNQYSVMMMLAASKGELFDDYVPKDNNWSPEVLDLLRKCLRRDPAARPTAIELLSHPWITMYGDEPHEGEYNGFDANTPMTRHSTTAGHGGGGGGSGASAIHRLSGDRESIDDLTSAPDSFYYRTLTGIASCDGDSVTAGCSPTSEQRRARKDKKSKKDKSKKERHANRDKSAEPTPRPPRGLAMNHSDRDDVLHMTLMSSTNTSRDGSASGGDRRGFTRTSTYALREEGGGKPSSTRASCGRRTLADAHISSPLGFASLPASPQQSGGVFLRRDEGEYQMPSFLPSLPPAMRSPGVASGEFTPRGRTLGLSLGSPPCTTNLPKRQ